MRKSLSYKILLSVLGITSLYVFYNPVASAITYEDSHLNGEGAPITITDNKIIIDKQPIELKSPLFVYGNDLDNGDANNNQVITNNSQITTVYGGQGINANNNKVILNNGSNSTYVIGGYSETGEDKPGETNGNTVIINKSTVKNVYGGYSHCGSANNNIVIIDNSVVDDNVPSAIIGGFAPKGKGATGNIVKIIGNSNIENASIYGGRSDIDNINVITGNTLTLDGWSGNTQSVQNFNVINFKNIKWSNSGTVLNITNNDKANALADTYLNHDNVIFTGGTEIATGNTMTLITGENLGIDSSKINSTGNFTAGVAIEGTGTAEVASDGNSVKYTLTKVKHTDQIDLVAENRAVAAAFVSQGTDLISDSLDTISRDSNYGVKTFAAVHGNRSKYDVNSDIKINGWSTIVGVGNTGKFDNSSEFSWGVFYENGSGNYRTYNEFNNEFFRGDGSLVYNGGGIAARYTNKNGVYTEGSLRAGMLKSDMDNALRDGAGNFYGYESESAYYGAHIGIGKIISLSDSSDLDVYGKFFHTYTEGDSFKVANDEFEFDSINSDRLRIGARITSNKENKFSTYYGLAYEYEFNGDADMTAQGLKAPTQSLQGSSVMAEIGFNYQPTPTSPWSFDLNMRGYAGERQGGSFNVQVTYTF